MKRRAAVFGWLVAFLGAGLGARTAGAGTVPPEALLLPADRPLLLGVDVRALLGSVLWSQLAAGDLAPLPDVVEPEESERLLRRVKAEADRRLADVERSSGIRLDRDVDWALAALDPTDGSKTAPLFILTGRFQAARVLAAWEARAGRPEAVRTRSVGRRTLRWFERPGGGTRALAFLDARTLALGALPDVERVVAARERAAALLPARLQALAAQPADLFLDARAGAAPAVSRFLVAGHAAPPDPQRLRLTHSFGEGAEVAAELLTEGQAAEAAPTLQGPLVRYTQRLDEEDAPRPVAVLAELLSGVSVHGEGRTVRVSAPAPAVSAFVAYVALPALLREWTAPARR